MVKRAAAGFVLFLAAGVAGCGKDPGEPSFPRVVSVPPPPQAPTIPVAEFIPPSVPRGAPAAPPAREEPLHVGGEITEPVEIVRTEPDCRLLEGAARPIVVELIVTKEGAVEGARVLTKAPADAKAAILESVRGWRFRPSTFNGRAVPVYFTVALRRCP